MSNSTALTKRTKAFEVKNIIIRGIQAYHLLVSPLLHNVLGLNTACRNTPSCSEYAQEIIRERGAVKGVLLSIRRLINCQPLFKI